jgi:two-component sensor histidine kinase
MSLYLLEEISHRVMNEYAAAIGDLSLAASRSASAQARSTLTHAAERLRTHADAHRALLAPADEGLVDVAAYLGRLCASMTNALLADREIRLMAEIDEVWLDSGRCWRIGLVVAELIRNAVRHGLAGRSGRIHLMLTKRPGRISCVVSDNGAGEPHCNQGRGRRLVEMLAAELGGTARWRFTPTGCVAGLEFPDVD